MAVSSKPNRRLASVFAIVGLLFFVFSMGSTMGTAQKISEARQYISEAITDQSKASELTPDVPGAVSLQSCLDTMGKVDAGADAETDPEADAKAKAEAAAKAAVIRRCLPIWRMAMVRGNEQADLPSNAIQRALAWTVRGFLRLISLFSPDASELASRASVDLAPYFLLASFSLFCLFASLGFASHGRFFGLLINRQNRLSIAYAQMVLWSIVLLAALAVYTAFNVGLVGSRSVFEGAETTKSLLPAFDGWMLSVMGIVVASPVIAGWIKGKKPSGSEGEPELVSVNVPVLPGGLKPLSIKTSAAQASLGDLLFGEDVNNDRHVDITRVQNLVLTILLLVIFSGWLAQSMSAIGVERIALAMSEFKPALPRFPRPGGVFAGLLAISHATYLSGKVQMAGNNAQAGAPT